MRGKRGEKGVGERGPQGEGVGMLRIVAWTIDGYLAIPTFSNAQIGAALDLRPALEAYHAEAGA